MADKHSSRGTGGKFVPRHPAGSGQAEPRPNAVPVHTPPAKPSSPYFTVDKK